MSGALGHRAPGGRLKEGVRPELSAVSYPVPEHRIAPVLAAVHRFDKAHVVMLVERAVIPRADGRALLGALRAMEGGDVVRHRLDIGGGNHSGEIHLTRALGEAVAGKIHTGRSSGDLSSVANRLTQQDRSRDLAATLLDLARVVVTLGGRDIDVLMPGYSHLQHAQPTTLGHYWLGWSAQFERDLGRLLDLYRRCDVSPAGAAVLTGSPFAVDPARTAALLGFARAFDNSRDATWAHDAYLEALWVLSMVCNSMARLAEDLNVWATAEFGFVELADGFCLNSSILPQKKNPIALEHIRGVAGIVAGRLAAGLAITRAPSDACVFDRYLVTADLWTSFDDCAGAARLLAAVLDSLSIDAGRMRAVLDASWAWASDLAALLVKAHGLSWRTAQQVVSVMVRQAIEAGRPPRGITAADVSRAAETYTGQPLPVTPETLAQALEPQLSINGRIVPGGPAHADMLAQIAGFERRLDELARCWDGFGQRSEQAAAALEGAIDAILAEDGADRDPSPIQV